MKTPNLDWRSRASSEPRVPSPEKSRSGGTPQRGKTVVRGKTKPDEHQNCNLGAYTQRRVSHKSSR